MNVDLEVTTTVTAPGAADAFVGDPGRWLPAPAHRRGPTAWVVELGAGTLHRDVTLELGPTRLSTRGLRRSVRWDPSEDDHLIPLEALLPVFVGEIRLVAGPGPGDRVQLVGSYRPPGGLAGGLLDRAGLHRVAEATARGFVAAVAGHLCDPREAHETHRVLSPA